MALSDDLMAMVPVYGPGLIGAITFASCVALPVPASLAMLIGGAFAATGDLDADEIAAAALAGAVAGDQIGWWLGRTGAPLLMRMAATPARRRLLDRAQSRLNRHALPTVYLSRWLFSPLGPWVNLAAGAAGMKWAPFTLASVTGETTWVALYVGLGWVFASQVDRLGGLVADLSGFAAAAVVAALLARAVWRKRRGRP
ncbi:membrane protein DedA, SNARE-associated domain [Gemmobacter megaterium]|uniref:Membrane protein DedA, SNARE-associated domain n=1 Tax=Gemmobacter megaterium TaxID=1086013 RepID=A0A1N7LRK5_9RHOB|nr:VTT domain-containing protein [Gemmobacter megaterium]GGE10978.1 hypothetical protein GCM10011345_16210 [Gemmobacter megaterium]SIS76331.1 membrane protein DedA, SNARE-associated domain [Gemmobacter megaterium]